jgi:rod shape-determining protein MreD
MSELLKHIIRFILFLLIQVFILFQIKPLHEFIVPYLYYVYLLWMPFKTPRLNLLFLGFFFGLMLDYFTKTPGLHAFVCTLVAYLRPFVIGLLLPQNLDEVNYREPSAESMGWAPYITYVVVMTLLHHVSLVLLEWIQFAGFGYFIGKVLGTSAVSLLLILLTELLSFRKPQSRSNIA